MAASAPTWRPRRLSTPAPAASVPRSRTLTDEDQLDWTIRQEFKRAFAQLDAIGLPLDAAVGDAAARAQVEALLAEVKSMRQLVSQELAPALDLLVGFNAMDGD